MTETKQSLAYDIRRTWVWDVRKKILYLFTREIDSSLFCNIIHKLTHFSPRRILINIGGDWHEVLKEHLCFLKECSLKVRMEKNRLYKTLSEKILNDNINLKEIQGRLCIIPYYGSLYLSQVLNLNGFSGFLTRCDFGRERDIFFKNHSEEYRYVIGHLLYSIDSENSLYRISFLSDNYFWINKELSMFLRNAYSEEMLRSGRLKHIYTHRFKTGFKFLNVLTTEEIEEPVRRSLVKHAVYSSMGLSKIFPLIVDENVQSFFLDDINERFYVDHAVFGRLNTNIIFRDKDFESFVTLVKRESNLNLDYANPSIKTSIVFDRIRTRVSIDIPPLTWSRGVIDVRKHMANVLSFKHLLKTQYFSPESAAFLIIAMLNRANISIVGEPNSGKTSLLNFLSYFMPSWWRIVHIEDALETLPSKVSGQHRVIYIVEPFESREVKSTKTLEIIKVLHRTPSYLILGEVQTKSHVKAMFQAVSAGLRVMHTAHASDSNGFVKRLVEVYGIPRLLVSELDVIIVMKKMEMRSMIKRFINEITIVDEDSSPKMVYSKSIFSVDSSFYNDLNVSKIFEKLAHLNCMRKETVQKMYEETVRIINNYGYSENSVIKSLIQEAYLKILKDAGDYKND